MYGDKGTTVPGYKIHGPLGRSASTNVFFGLYYDSSHLKDRAKTSFCSDFYHDDMRRHVLT